MEVGVHHQILYKLIISYERDRERLKTWSKIALNPQITKAILDMGT